eukprot:gene838-644_t
MKWHRSSGSSKGVRELRTGMYRTEKEKHHTSQSVLARKMRCANDQFAHNDIRFDNIMIDVLTGTTRVCDYGQCPTFCEAANNRVSELEEQIANAFGAQILLAGARRAFQFCATFSEKMKKICADVLRPKPHFARVRIGNYKEDKGGSCEHIEQVIVQKFNPEDKQSTIIKD